MRRCSWLRTRRATSTATRWWSMAGCRAATHIVRVTTSGRSEMKTQQLLNYERDRWIAGDGNLAEIPSAIDGAAVAMTGSSGLDFGGMLRHAREVGGPALRALTFHERAR